MKMSKHQGSVRCSFIKRNGNCCGENKELHEKKARR
jgi:hypothetical protein